MRRPEYLKATTVVETRKEIKANLKTLERTGWLLTNGFVDLPSETERWLNAAMTEYVIQQEYLREREADNWGWDKKTVDFSKIA